jgi:hypothetical protein
MLVNMFTKLTEKKKAEMAESIRVDMN